MSSEIELVSDGDGLAVIGDGSDVERFLLHAGLRDAPSKELDLQSLSSFASRAGAAAAAASTLSANSGRWVKLTKDSAAAVREFGLMATKTPGVSHAMIGNPGDIQRWIQIVKAPSALLGGPLAITALATMMQQQAMQQQMDEIVDYLEQISEKVDDILRNQQDAVLSEMIGAELIVEEAMTIRGRVGRVSDVTWSKVQSTGLPIASTQAYALRQLDAIAARLAEKTDLGDVANATNDAVAKVSEWLAVLARTFQLQEGIGILELDRVLDDSPEDLERHRIGLIAARRDRLELITRSTATLLTQMDATVTRANSKVLFNPFDSPAAVKSSNAVATGVIEFHSRLGIDYGQDTKGARRWTHAAAEVRDSVVTSAGEGAALVGRLGADAAERTADAFRPIDVDGDGIADGSPITIAAKDVGGAIGSAASDVGGVLKSLFGRRSADQDGETSESEGPA